MTAIQNFVTTLGDRPDFGVVRVSVPIHPCSDFSTTLTIMGIEPHVSIDLARCPLCQALTLPHDASGHRDWHQRTIGA